MMMVLVVYSPCVSVALWMDEGLLLYRAYHRIIRGLCQLVHFSLQFLLGIDSLRHPRAIGIMTLILVKREYLEEVLSLLMI